MPVITVHRAKTTLSKLIERACAGEDIVIARGSTPAVRLTPVAKRGRKFGAMRGRVKVDPTFFEPLPEEELSAWEK
jgi:prevent-host-death family protein